MDCCWHERDNQSASAITIHPWAGLTGQCSYRSRNSLIDILGGDRR